MHRRSLVVSLLVVFAACGQSRTGGRIAGGVLTGYGLLGVYSGATCSSHKAEGFGDAIACGINEDMMPVSIAILAVGLTTLIANEAIPRESDRVDRVAAVAPEPIVEEPAEPLPEPPTSDPRLRVLTLQAAAAARREQCAEVGSLAARVDAIDGAYRSGGFLADAQIAACLR